MHNAKEDSQEAAKQRQKGKDNNNAKAIGDCH
jgi:hypothetical protein